jgi:hypothetical protein
VATITTVVDATAKFVAEILFLTVGLMIVLAHGEGLGATTPIPLGLGAALIAGVIAMRVQHRATSLFVWFGRRVLRQWVAAGSDGETVSEAELTRIYGPSTSHAGGRRSRDCLAGNLGRAESCTPDGQLETCVCGQSDIIIDYATARRREEPISTAVTESTEHDHAVIERRARRPFRWRHDPRD